MRVTAAVEAALRAGHPWVFADRIRQQNRPGQAGELAVIYDRKNRFLAVGLFDPDSPIRVRVLQAGQPGTIDPAWWSARLAQALDRRRDLFDDQTTGYRLIHGESDGWPGLVLDRYGATLVLKLYTAAWWPRLDDIARLMVAGLNPERMVLRSSRNLRRRLEPGSAAGQRAGESAGVPSCRRGGPEEGNHGGSIPYGSPLSGPVVFLESGLRFEADVLRGQKTGFFLDQRENRRQVELLAPGRRVLNAFSFSGGFSLYAARGGARSVTDLDISAHALAGARRNFVLNSTMPAVGHCPHEMLQADVFEWFDANRQRKFDLIILDPPSFAKRETERAAAIRAYEQLAGRGVAQLARGGVLVACSCSAHVGAGEFFEAVRRAAGGSGRAFRELQTTGHPPDHPATFKEAEYLKAIYLRLN
jgi:23S rRNA (cytosine1962-C5)-methyltransferase